MTPSIFPNPSRTALVVVDIQERLLVAMGEAGEGVVQRTLVLLELAAEYGMPVVYTEQYPRGLGPTEPRLLARLTELGAERVEKVEFSCCRNASFATGVLPKLPSHLMVTGMETHICVLQTVADLQARGHQVFVPLDATCSRTSANHGNGLELIRQVGAVVSNTETLLFSALQQAGTDSFRKLSKLIR